jgi:hypothetical protein
MSVRNYVDLRNLAAEVLDDRDLLRSGIQSVRNYVDLRKFFFLKIEEQREREVRAEKEEREVFVTNDFFCEG